MKLSKNVDEYDQERDGYEADLKETVVMMNGHGTGGVLSEEHDDNNDDVVYRVKKKRMLMMKMHSLETTSLHC